MHALANGTIPIGGRQYGSAICLVETIGPWRIAQDLTLNASRQPDPHPNVLAFRFFFQEWLRLL